MTSEDGTPSPSFVERRRHPRYPVTLPIDLWQTAGVVLGGVVTDMSEAGLGFRSTHAIQISTDLGIRVYLSRGEFSFDSIEGNLEKCLSRRRLERIKVWYVYHENG